MLVYYLELAEYILKAILGLMWMIYFVYLSFKESD